MKNFVATDSVAFARCVPLATNVAVTVLLGQKLALANRADAPLVRGHVTPARALVGEGLGALRAGIQARRCVLRRVPRPGFRPLLASSLRRVHLTLRAGLTRVAGLCRCKLDLGALVYSQAVVAREAPAALVAEERLGDLVLTAVERQRPLVAEGLGAEGAAEGPGAAVHGQPVPAEGLRVDEGLAALGAQHGPLARVLAAVGLQPAVVVEGDVALLAAVRLVARVLLAHVPGVGPAVAEAVGADEADPGMVGCVVRQQLFAALAQPAADAAEQRHVATGGLEDVELDSLQGVEGGPASVALKLGAFPLAATAVLRPRGLPCHLIGASCDGTAARMRPPVPATTRHMRLKLLNNPLAASVSTAAIKPLGKVPATDIHLRRSPLHHRPGASAVCHPLAARVGTAAGMPLVHVSAQRGALAERLPAPLALEGLGASVLRPHVRLEGELGPELLLAEWAGEEAVLVPQVLVQRVRVPARQAAPPAQEGEVCAARVDGDVRLEPGGGAEAFVAAWHLASQLSCPRGRHSMRP